MSGSLLQLYFFGSAPLSTFHIDFAGHRNWLLGHRLLAIDRISSAWSTASSSSSERAQSSSP